MAMVKMMRIITSSGLLLLLSLALPLARAQDPCEAEDTAHDDCLDAVGATEGQTTLCEACIEAIAENPVISGATGDFCPLADRAACAALSACPCQSCTAEAKSKGQCEVDDERSTSTNSSCAPLDCSAFPDPPSLPPISFAPAGTPAPAPPTVDPCATEDSALDTCLEAASATDLEKDACDGCIELIAEVAGGTSEQLCMVADTGACAGLRACQCKNCDEQVISKGQCEIDAKRTDNASTCGQIDCDAAGSPTTSPAPMAIVNDPCAAEDAALDSCLEIGGATDGQKDTCDGCIEVIVRTAGLVSAPACQVGDNVACEGLKNCPCGTCNLEAISKGECEIDAERADNGSSCGPIDCGAGTGAPTGPVDPSGPTEPPAGPTDPPAPTMPTVPTVTDPPTSATAGRRFVSIFISSSLMTAAVMLL